MKKQLLGLSVLAAFLSTSALAAGPIANIEVTGDIKPPTCSVNSGDNNILFEFGSISPSVIADTFPYALPLVSSNITITCDSMTYLSFKGEDSYASADTIYPPKGWSAPRKGVTFTLVDADDIDKTIGGISFDLIQPTVDGNSVFISNANDGENSSSPTWGFSNRIVKGATMGWTASEKKDAPVTELDFVAGKVFSATIKNSIDADTNGANSYILPKESLTVQDIELSQGINYMGEAVLTFNFGV